MRVLHIIGDSRFGGIGWILLGLGRLAKAEGWQVDVLTTNPTLQQTLQRHGMGVVDLDVIRREIRPAWDFSGMLRLRDFLQSESYGIVHTHTSKAGFVGRLAAHLAGVPVIIHTAHGFAFHELSPRSVRLFYSTLERMASRWCDRIVSVSEFHCRWALELGICRSQNIIAIPNGIAAVSSSTAFAPAKIRRQLGAQPDDLLILSTARLAADKGIECLVKAAGLLPPIGRRYHVIVAGDGPERARLESLTSDLGLAGRVTFLGFREDVPELLAACDLVVLPSLREGLSIALLEAMAAGKPIVASDIGSNRELASQTEMARLVPPADPKALAEAIRDLSRNPELMAHLAKGARALFESRYTEDRMLDGYRRLYLELVQRKLPAHVVPAARNDSPPADIRGANHRDLAGIVRIHQKAFRHFFLTRLGDEFLSRYYRMVLDYHAGIVLVMEGRRGLEGFVCGFLNPAEFYRSMWRNKREFVLPALSALVRNPALAAGILNGIQRIQSSASQSQAQSCELASIAVAPESSGYGLGKTLVQAFLARSWSMNAQCVYLTTDADANDHANTLYREAGFERSRRFLQRRGRWMNEYVVHRTTDECQEILS